MSIRRLDFRLQSYATKVPFTIARGTKTKAEQIIVSITEEVCASKACADKTVAQVVCGYGACVPYPRNGESIESVIAQIQNIKPEIENGLDIEGLQSFMPPGAARNAIDCALWDLNSHLAGKPVWMLNNILPPKPRITATTVSILTPDETYKHVKKLIGYPLLKLKLAGDALDVQRVKAAIAAASLHTGDNVKFILDANESLERQSLDLLYNEIDPHVIAMIEQPVAAGEDEVLQGVEGRGLLCADESIHTNDDIAKLAPYYGIINIKLDKSGGFSGALSAARCAKDAGLKIMLGSSLAMAPAFLLESFADYLDLDGPILLAEDDDGGFEVDGALMYPNALWGTGGVEESEMTERD